MGEIYRAASVTGTRRLARGKLDRDTPAAEQKKPANPDSARDAIAASGAVAASGRDEGHKNPESNAQSKGTMPSAAASAKPSVAAELASQRDLAAAQERRIQQLEAENDTLKAEAEELRADLAHFVAHLATLKDDAHSEGYAAGEAQAVEAQQQTQQTQQHDFEQLKYLFSTSLEAQLDRVEDFAIDIAFAALTRLVGERVRDELFNRAVISAALADIRAAQTVTIHVSEHDYKTLSAFEETLRAEGRYSDVVFAADPRVSVGGCMIETDNGIWDARLETQLQRLRDAVAQSRERTSP